jgi:tellurite methyltransferase
MPSSQSDWDTKYRVTAEAPPAQPASIVSELLPLLPKGAALDIACGTGRHTLLLASRGQHVTALDWSAAGLDILEVRAKRMKVPLHRIHSFDDTQKSSRGGIELIQADLESTTLPQQSFDLILCIQYLQRSLFSQMTRALRPGGVLLFETFTRAQLEFEGGPRNPAYLLEQGELREAFPELRVLFYRELRAGQGIASLLAQKRGRKSGAGGSVSG